MSNLKKVTKAFVIGLIAWPSWSAWPYIPVFTGNGSSSVTNTISVEANSGGNTVSPGGSITTSGASTDIYLETKINGETVEHVEQHINSSTSTQFKYEKKFEKGNARVETRIDTSSEADGARTGKLDLNVTPRELQPNGEINLQRQPAQAAPIATPPAPKKSFIKRLEALITYVFKFFTT